jgi:integrase
MNLTKHAIEKLEKIGRYFDDRTRGLGIAVNETGSRQFFWLRKVRGRRTWRTIGDFPDLSLENARKEADRLNTILADWKATGYKGPSPFDRHSDPTLAAILEDYIARHLRSKAKRPETAEKRIRQVAKYFGPLLKRQLSAITRADVRALHASVANHPLKRAGDGRCTANRVIGLLRTLLYWAIDSEQFHGENPARRFKLFAEKSRDRFVQPAEAPRLLAALKVEPNRDLRDFVILSLFTGARMMDVLSMRWRDISLEAKLWTIPDPKNKTPYVVPLLIEAVDVLRERHARNGASEWVFPARKGTKSGHVTTIKRSWQGLMARAKIEGLHRHDLRRTLGSWMAMQGASLPVIGKALGHRNLNATQIYSRLDIAPVREGMESATKALKEAKAEEASRG